jgi:chromate transporter
MIRKMHKKPIPRAIMVCSAAVMLAVELFDLPVSSITLMVAAALVSLGIFAYQKPKKGGAAK